MKQLVLFIFCINLVSCGTEPEGYEVSTSESCEKMLSNAKWGVYPSGMISGTCGRLPSFWIHTDVNGALDMSGDDCELVRVYLHEDECREHTSIKCNHPDRDLNANFNFSLVRTLGLENSIQYNGTLMVGLADFETQMTCESMYEVRVIHHPNGVTEE